ncbi:hypothetical protein X781_7750 [Mannheimia sp. USDA-ARS-USMARC-1261]|nr:hypothetical protein X781_7750 [Mannheimia sp. USDA-ARS-USMARC-1261]
MISFTEYFYKRLFFLNFLQNVCVLTSTLLTKQNANIVSKFLVKSDRL